MRPRKTENRDLPPGVYLRKRTSKSKKKPDKEWISYYYRDKSDNEITLGTDLSLARLKWAELEAKEKPKDLVNMGAIFDRYERDIIPKKASRTQKDNLAEMLRHRWDGAREEAVREAVAAGDQVLAGRISQLQFRDIRPKAASEITDVDRASLLLGHTKGDIIERVYHRVGALPKPTK